MDKSDAERLAAEIVKINFLLENLYATVCRDRGITHDGIPRIAEELCRQAELPMWGGGPEDAEQQQMAVHRIAQFFANVQARLRPPESG